MWHRQNKNKHGRNWVTLPFKKPWSGLVVSERKGTEAGNQVSKTLGMNLRVTKGNKKIGKASAVMRALHYLVAMKRELSKKAKLSIFQTTFVSIIIYG